MSIHARMPSCRSLDIYRLVVARGIKQATVAEWFCVTPPRISQIVSRVRQWVNHSIGNWLFPGRDDLRFYVALECAQVRVEESPEEPENVVFTGPSWTHTRRVTPTRSVSEGCDTPTPSVSEEYPTQARSASEGCDRHPAAASGDPETPANTTTNTPLNISAEPLNSPLLLGEHPLDANHCAATPLMPPHIEDLARRLAELLIVWKKTRSISTAVRSRFE